MSSQNDQSRLKEATVEQIAAGIRSERVTDEAVDGAAQRVWARVAGAPAVTHDDGRIRGCGDFQGMIPAWLAGTLAEPRVLLLQDHLRECVECRHAVVDAKAGVHHRPAAAATVDWSTPAWTKPARPIWMRGWALAAVLLAGIGLGLLGVGRWFESRPVNAVVQSVDGGLYHLSDAGSVALAAGQAVAASQEIRTADNSSAVVRLGDGSKVEMGKRADLWFSRSWRGTTIHLERGNVIVQAAPQGRGHLDVATRDCLVAVKGTIFDVDEGLNGGRVSVIQGVVQVTQGRKVHLLHPGQQFTTRASLGQVPVSQTVAWSRNSGEYLALLGEFSTLRHQLEAIPGPAPRYDSALLKMVPADTVFYAAIPNIGSTLAQADRVFQDRIQQSPVLQQWWNQQKASGQAQKTQEMMDRLKSFSDYLGNEVVIAMPAAHQSPVVLAEVKGGDFGSFVQGQLGQVNTGNGLGVVLVNNPAAITPGAKNRLLIYLKNNFMVGATDPAELQRAAAVIGGGGSTGFASTPFGQAIAKAYQGGAGWLFCANVEQILSTSVLSMREAKGPRYEPFKDPNIGLVDLRYLIVGSKDVGGQTQNTATLTFDQERRGIASWLAQPSPLGTLDFVSPAASLAVSFAVKQPRDILQDILKLGEATDPKFSQGLSDFETESGVDIRDDLAASIGGELTFALDGPLLPAPSWKLALEVNDSTRLESALEKLVAGFNRQAAQHGGRASLTHTTAGGITYYDLRLSPGAHRSGAGNSNHETPTDIHYVLVDGYLLAAPNQALLASSIQNREAGYTLARSSQFANRLPVDGYANPSGVIYQNLWSAVGPIASELESSPALTASQKQSLAAIGQNASPSLICLYGEPDRIVVAGTGNIFGLGFESLFGMRGAGPFELLQLIGKAGGQG